MLDRRLKQEVRPTPPRAFPEPRELARHIEHGDLRTEGRITPFVLRAAGEEKRCCREGQEPDRASAQDRRHPHHGEEWVPSRNGRVLLRPQAGQERLPCSHSTTYGDNCAATGSIISLFLLGSLGDTQAREAQPHPPLTRPRRGV